MRFNLMELIISFLTNALDASLGAHSIKFIAPTCVLDPYEIRVSTRCYSELLDAIMSSEWRRYRSLQ
jgi:hypothetical protein